MLSNLNIKRITLRINDLFYILYTISICYHDKDAGIVSKDRWIFRLKSSIRDSFASLCNYKQSINFILKIH